MAANPVPPLAGKTTSPVQVNLCEAKSQLSSLVERAAKGEEFVIAKAGKPMARLSAIAPGGEAPQILRSFGQNLLGIEFLSDGWEDDIPLSCFEDEGRESPFGDEIVPAQSE